MENHHFEWDKSTMNHHFPVRKLLVYQRVAHVVLKQVNYLKVRFPQPTAGWPDGTGGPTHMMMGWLAPHSNPCDHWPWHIYGGSTPLIFRKLWKCEHPQIPACQGELTHIPQKDWIVKSYSSIEFHRDFMWISSTNADRVGIKSGDDGYDLVGCASQLVSG